MVEKTESLLANNECDFKSAGMAKSTGKEFQAVG